MTYREHQIFIDVWRDAGDCFWLALTSVSWAEGENKHVITLKRRPQDRFVRATEAKDSAIRSACEWVDNRIRNGPPVKKSPI